MSIARSGILIASILVLGAGSWTHSRAQSGSGNANGIRSTIATGGVYGGATQASTTCYVFNAGPDEITVESLQIIAQDGTPTTDFDVCSGVTLNPSESCSAAAVGLAQEAHSCVVTYRGHWWNQVRGTMDVRATDNEVLTSSPLR